MGLKRSGNSCISGFDKDTKKMGTGVFGHEGDSEFLISREKIINSKAFVNYVSKTRPVSDIVGNFSGKIIKRYNMPK